MTAHLTTSLEEQARAKINLTLTISGRRGDGYHELLSLVAFAGREDRVTLRPGEPAGLTVTGPFAAAIEGENLITKALDTIARENPRLTLGHVVLEKNLPVAAGMGGGSADAAAVLRCLSRANPALAADVAWPRIARELGADVLICLADRAQWMSGVGEILHPLDTPLPALDAVLVNPLAPVPPDKTARVFRALGAPPATPGASAAAVPRVPDRVELLALMRRTGNDLEAPAISVIPAIGDVLEALEACADIQIAQISGAGPTCFGVFPSATTAQAAAAQLAAAHPEWWVEATVIA